MKLGACGEGAFRRVAVQYRPHGSVLDRFALAIYGTFEVGGLFLYGIVLGTARHCTSTLLVPLLLHALSNTWARATAFNAAG